MDASFELEIWVGVTELFRLIEMTDTSITHFEESGSNEFFIAPSVSDFKGIAVTTNGLPGADLEWGKCFFS